MAEYGLHLIGALDEIGSKEAALRGLPRSNRRSTEIDEAKIGKRFTSVDASDPAGTALRMLDGFFLCDEAGAAVEIEALEALSSAAAGESASAAAAAPARRRLCAFGTVVELRPAKGATQPTFYIPGGALPVRTCVKRQRVFLPSIVDWCVEYDHADPSVWIVTDAAWYKISGARWGMDLRPHADFAPHFATTARKVEACVQLRRVLADFLPQKKAMSYRSSFNEALARSQADRSAALVHAGCAAPEDGKIRLKKKTRPGGVYVAPAITADFVLAHHEFVTQQLLANDIEGGLIAKCNFIAKLTQQSEVAARRRERERIREEKLRVKAAEKERAREERVAVREERQRDKLLLKNHARSIRQAEKDARSELNGGRSRSRRRRSGVGGTNAKELLHIDKLVQDLPPSSTWWSAAAEAQRYRQRSAEALPPAASASASAYSASTASAEWPIPTTGALIPRYAVPQVMSTWELLMAFNGKDMLRVTPFAPEVLQQAILCPMESALLNETHIALLSWLRDEQLAEHAEEHGEEAEEEGAEEDDGLASENVVALWRRAKITQVTWPEVLRQLMLLQGCVSATKFSTDNAFIAALPAPLRTVLTATMALLGDDRCEPFAAPVSLVLHPEYTNYVDDPIDVTEIERRLINSEYLLEHPSPLKAAYAAVGDMRRVWANCIAYNGVEAPIAHDARVMSKKFERILRKCEHLQSFALVEDATKAPATPAAAAAPAKVASAVSQRGSSRKRKQTSKGAEAERQSQKKQRKKGDAVAAMDEEEEEDTDEVEVVDAVVGEEEEEERELPSISAAVYALGQREYYEVSLGTKVVLLNWLCDAVLGMERMRTMLGDREEKRLKLQKEYRRVAAEHHKIIALKSAEAEIATFKKKKNGGGPEADATVAAVAALAQARNVWGRLHRSWIRDLGAVGVRSEPVGYDRYRRRYRTFLGDMSPRLWVEDPRNGDLGFYETRRELEQLRRWISPKKHGELDLCDAVDGMLSEFEERLGKWERKVGMRSSTMYSAPAAKVVPLLCRASPRAAEQVNAAWKRVVKAREENSSETDDAQNAQQLTRELSAELRMIAGDTALRCAVRSVADASRQRLHERIGDLNAEMAIHRVPLSVHVTCPGCQRVIAAPIIEQEVFQCKICDQSMKMPDEIVKAPGFKEAREKYLDCDRQRHELESGANTGGLTAEAYFLGTSASASAAKVDDESEDLRVVAPMVNAAQLIAIGHSVHFSFGGDHAVPIHRTAGRSARVKAPPFIAFVNRHTQEKRSEEERLVGRVSVLAQNLLHLEQRFCRLDALGDDWKAEPATAFRSLVGGVLARFSASTEPITELPSLLTLTKESASILSGATKLDLTKLSEGLLTIERALYEAHAPYADEANEVVASADAGPTAAAVVAGAAGEEGVETGMAMEVEAVALAPAPAVAVAAVDASPPPPSVVKKKWRRTLRAKWIDAVQCAQTIAQLASLAFKLEMQMADWSLLGEHISELERRDFLRLARPQHRASIPQVGDELVFFPHRYESALRQWKAGLTKMGEDAIMKTKQLAMEDRGILIGSRRLTARRRRQWESDVTEGGAAARTGIALLASAAAKKPRVIVQSTTVAGVTYHRGENGHSQAFCRVKLRVSNNPGVSSESATRLARQVQRNICRALRADPCSTHFREPVDPAKFPTYANIISDPIDLQTILEKVRVCTCVCCHAMPFLSFPFSKCSPPCTRLSLSPG